MIDGMLEMKTQRRRLLHEWTGVAGVNWGLDSGLYVTLAPVQHFAVRHINRIFDHLQDLVDGNWKTAGP